MKIKKIKARKIIATNKKPTIEITINNKFTASAPSGSSKGSHEVKDFPKNVNEAIKKINNNKELIGLELNTFEELEVIEDIVEKGNTLIALEYAILKALSKNNVYSFLNPDADNLPMPIGNVIGGGAHIKNGNDFQEYLLIPKAKSFFDASFVNDHIYRRLALKLKTKRRTIEGALAPNLSIIEILDLLKKEIEEVEYELGFPIKLGLDVAASQLYKDNVYNYKTFSKKDREGKLNRENQIKFILKLIKRYSLFYVEDPLQEEDFEGFQTIKDRALNTLICGDDLICTNEVRLRKALNAVNALIIKPNQIGSLIETKKVINLAKSYDITPIISHRSGETTEDIIADLAVAFNIPYIKCGIFGRDRRSKINRLIQIEKEISKG